MKNKLNVSLICSILILLLSCSSEPKKVISKESTELTDTLAVKDTSVSLPVTSVTTEEEKDIPGIEFGYCNEEGKQILLLRDSLVAPEKLVKVISDSGKIADITFIKKRVPGKEDNNRQTYFNFKNAGGYLYEVKNASVSKEWSLVLVSEEFLSQRKMLSLTGGEKIGLATELRTKIENDKQRKIKKIKRIKKINLNRRINFFEFIIKKN